MLGVAVLVSTMIVALSLAFVVGRSELGAGMALATVEVAKTAPQYWQRPLPYPPAGAVPLVELTSPEPPRRWAWSGGDLPPAPPAMPRILAPLASVAPKPAAPAPAAKPAPQPQPDEPKWEIWDGDELWHA